MHAPGTMEDKSSVDKEQGFERQQTNPKLFRVIVVFALVQSFTELRSSQSAFVALCPAD